MLAPEIQLEVDRMSASGSKQTSADGSRLPFNQTLECRGQERVEYDGLWYFIKMKKKNKPLKAN